MMSTGRQSRASNTGSLAWRICSRLVTACAGCALLLGMAQAQAATVVTDTVISQSSQTQTSIPVTFGQVFKSGDVPAGSTVLATLNGQTIPLQVDTKATNPDGSLRHAVLTAIVPSLPGGGSLPLTLVSGSPAASMAQGSPVSLSQLLATSYDAKVSLNIGGTTYSVNARGLLQAADLAGTCAPWDRQCNTWLSGPLVSAWVVNGPLTSSAGNTNPNLSIYFVVRAYAGTTPGTVGYVRTDIIVENSNAYAPQGQPQYTATLTSGSASYTSPALTQYAYTRWHKVLWWNNAEPQVYLQQDTQYIQNSMAVSRYENLEPDQAFLNSQRQSCAPLDHCDQSQAMGNVGAQPAIGPLPRWTTVYINYPDVRAYHWMLANTDALGAYSVHFRDAATGWPLSIQKHPYVTILGWASAKAAAKGSSADSQGYGADLLPTCTNNTVVSTCTGNSFITGNPDTWSNAHQPAAGYVAYMVTGSYYYMGELAYYASMSELEAGPSYRGFSAGLIDAARSQVRGKAWVLRQMVNAAWLLPDGYPLKAEFNTDVNNAIADFNATYTNNPDANSLGIMNSGAQYPIGDKGNVGGTPWQHNFLTWSAGHAAELGFAGAASFRNWLAKLEIGLMTDWQNNPTNGFCWLLASDYKVQVKDTNGQWLPNYTAVYNATYPTLAGLTCNSPAMVSALATLQQKPWQAGQMSGYPASATGYPANFQTGLATAVDTGLPNAQAAWDIFESRSIKPSGSTAYNDYPNFALWPRSVPQTSGGPVPPPTNPISPTQPNPPSTTGPFRGGNDPARRMDKFFVALEPALRSALHVATQVAGVVLPGLPAGSGQPAGVIPRLRTPVNTPATTSFRITPSQVPAQPQPGESVREPMVLPVAPTGNRPVPFVDVFSDCDASQRNQWTNVRCARR